MRKLAVLPLMALLLGGCTASESKAPPVARLTQKAAIPLDATDIDLPVFLGDIISGAERQTRDGRIRIDTYTFKNRGGLMMTQRVFDGGWYGDNDRRILEDTDRTRLGLEAKFAKPDKVGRPQHLKHLRAPSTGHALAFRDNRDRACVVFKAGYAFRHDGDAAAPDTLITGTYCGSERETARVVHALERLGPGLPVAAE